MSLPATVSSGSGTLIAVFYSYCICVEDTDAVLLLRMLYSVFFFLSPHSIFQLDENKRDRMKT